MGKTLREVVESRPRRERLEVIARLYEDINNGKVKLVDPKPPSSILEYILRLEYSLWFYTALTLTLASILLIILSPHYNILYPFRYIFGALYASFLPGYSMIEALYPREGQLSDIEKLGLSIALSLAVVPIVGFALNYTREGITLNRIVTANAVLILVALFIALYRKYRYVAERTRSFRSF